MVKWQPSQLPFISSMNLMVLKFFNVLPYYDTLKGGNLDWVRNEKPFSMIVQITVLQRKLHEWETK
jgi:hypothetical protein